MLTDELIVDGDGFIHALPNVWGRHENYSKDLIGATIVRFGTIRGQRGEGGGLVIDYRALGSEETKRIILGFNDEGMGVESQE